MRYQPVKPLNLGQQLASLRREYPDDAGVLRSNVLEWTGTLTPSPVGRDYRVRLIYQLGARPVVRVLDPSLRTLAAGRTIPHLYSQEREELCVYLPGRREWAPEKLLTRTVLPWSVLWLYFSRIGSDQENGMAAGHTHGPREELLDVRAALGHHPDNLKKAELYNERAIARTVYLRRFGRSGAGRWRSL